MTHLFEIGRRALLTVFLIILTVLGSHSGSAIAAGEDADEAKPMIRAVFGLLSEAFAKKPDAGIPEAVEMIEFPGGKGFKLDPNLFEIRVGAWNEPHGLMKRYQKVAASESRLFAAVNGTFYSEKAALGPVIIDGKLPEVIRQYSGSLSRSYFAVLENGSVIFGETNQPADRLKDGLVLASTFINRELPSSSKACQLLGGLGWILRDGKDVHMESYQRQKFRFRKADQDSRRPVLAIDRSGKLYVLVFETGSNLEKVAAILQSNPAFDNISEAVFLDGGGSTSLIIASEYYVAPLYFADRARFTCIEFYTRREN